MLTFFTTCKPFVEANMLAQRNAIQSWLALGHACEVILVGDDDGTADVAVEFGLRHAPKVERNERGTPLLNSLFDTAQAMARHDMLCYLNADIMLMGDFIEAVRKLPPEHLLMISRRWNVDVEGSCDFADPEWDTRLRRHAHTYGYQKSIRGGPDFFVFRRGQWRDIPPFALGRTCFDNWLIYAAVSRGYPVIDASSSVMAIHQNHDCGHADGGWSGAWFGEEAARNRALAIDGSATYSFLDATHLMTPEGLKPTMAPEHMARRYERQLPKWFDRQLFLANTLLELGRHDEALRIIHEVGHVAGTPERTCRYNRAMLRVLLDMGKVDHAKEFVARIIAAEPVPTFAYHIASICEELRAFDVAIPLFRAITLDESHESERLKAGARYHLAQIAAETGDVEAARREAQACLDMNSNHGAAKKLLEKLDTEGASAVDDELIDAIKEIEADRAQAPATVSQPADARD